MTDTITRTLYLHQIEAMCSIGLHDFERSKKQRVLIDVEVRLNATHEPTSDDVSETLDYDEVHRRILEVAQARHYDLQESMARQIFDAISALKDVEGLSVQTQKPDAYPNCKTVAYRLSNLN